jgi:hypothetical protein
MFLNICVTKRAVLHMAEAERGCHPLMQQLQVLQGSFDHLRVHDVWSALGPMVIREMLNVDSTTA